MVEVAGSNPVAPTNEKAVRKQVSGRPYLFAEETCDRIFLIHNGRRVLYGNLVDIKARYGLHRVHFVVKDARWQLPSTNLVEQVTQDGIRWTCLLRPDVRPTEFMHALPQDAPVEEFHVARISLHDIFVRMATGREVA